MSTTAPQLLSGRYTADPFHATFSFAVRYAGVTTFRGTFGEVTATLTADADGIALEGAAQVESISIRTPEQFRGHVLGEDFFDAANHPQVTFRSTRVELAEDGRAVAEGELTMRGVSRPVRAEGSWVPETEALGYVKAGLRLEATVDRTDWGMVWNADLPAGGKALGNDVAITIELPLIPETTEA